MLKIEDYNKGLIYTDINRCIDCNKCVYECPILKSNVRVMDFDGKYKMCVDGKECVLCGTCMTTCAHKVRHFRDDCDDFFTDLSRGKNISVVVAPSFYLNYPDEYKKIFGYLKSLGVKSFYPVSFGADITIWGYLNFLKKNPGSYISQPCPSIVSHIEKHHPALLKDIIPVQSPLMCTAIYLKKYMKITNEIAFLSPCIAKKTEIGSRRGGGLVKYNVTFKRLAERLANVDINSFPDADVELGFDMGALFPMPGGMKENIEYYLGYEAMVMQVGGEHKAYEFLKSYASDKAAKNKLMPALVEILNCERGCCQGTGTDSRDATDNNVAYQMLIARSKIYSKGIPAKNRIAALNEKFKDLNPDDFTCSYEIDRTAQSHTISEKEIEAVFSEKLMKLSEHDKHINCAACGYKTCRQMAQAIVLGINHHDNCIYYVKNTLVKSMEEKSVSEADLRALINMLPLVVTIYDKHLNVLECNEETARMFEISSTSEYKTKFLSFWPEFQPDGTKSVEKAVRKVSEALTLGTVRFAWQHQKQNGEPIPTEVTLMRFKWRGKGCILAFLKDLRELHKFQENTRMMEERLKAMLDASPILCAIYDENYKVIEANQAAATLFGLSDKQVYVENIQAVCPELQPDGMPSLEKIPMVMEETLNSGSKKFEWMHCTVDKKTLIPCEVYLKRVRLGDRNIVIAFVRDMREQYQLQEMITELEASEERERLANQAKTRFLARMSHEIRTPLNSILGISELQLQKESIVPEIYDAFSRIYGSSNLLLNILNDILDLSKAEAGKMEVIPAVYDAASMIVDIVQLNLMYVGSKKIDFALKVDEKMPSLLIGDELRVKQILNNIISNAFKYTSKGTVNLSFCAEKSQMPDEIILAVKVCDTGQGMTEEQIVGLFDKKFTRETPEENVGNETSGLGLSIAHRLIQMMRGEILVESTPNEGSVFTVRIPQLLKNSDVLGKESAESLQNLDDTRNSLRRLARHECEPMPYGRVLVVDDVDSNLYITRGFLMAYKLFADTAQSGTEAIEKIKAGEVYDIIFMDHMMPEPDGIETTRIIREMGYYHPIVALTANAFADIAEMFINNGFSGYVSKPIDFSQIDKYLLRFIRDKQPIEVIEKARKAKAEAKPSEEEDFYD